MRELNEAEIDCVSGGLYLSDTYYMSCLIADWGYELSAGAPTVGYGLPGFAVASCPEGSNIYQFGGGNMLFLACI